MPRFPTTASLTEAFIKMRESYRSPDALDMINKLWDVREKVCWTYVQRYFTASSRADSRGEGQHSKLKDRGASQSCIV